jgi:hypothetical protein
VTRSISSIVRQCAQRECVFIQIGGFFDQGDNKIAAADIVREITEEFIAERVVTQILNNCTAVGIGVSLE